MALTLMAIPNNILVFCLRRVFTAKHYANVTVSL